MRHLMFANDDFDVNADVAGTAENFDDLPGRRKAALGIARDLHIDDGAIEFREAQAAVGAGRRPTRCGVFRAARE